MGLEQLKPVRGVGFKICRDIAWNKEDPATHRLVLLLGSWRFEFRLT